MVLGAYKQMHALDAPILSGADEDNFDRVFDAIRPGLSFLVLLILHRTMDKKC